VEVTCSRQFGLYDDALAREEPGRVFLTSITAAKIEGVTLGPLLQNKRGKNTRSPLLRAVAIPRELGPPSAGVWF
jgi:hypothetical protein